MSQYRLRHQDTTNQLLGGEGTKMPKDCLAGLTPKQKKKEEGREIRYTVLCTVYSWLSVSHFSNVAARPDTPLRMAITRAVCYSVALACLLCQSSISGGVSSVPSLPLLI